MAETSVGSQDETGQGALVAANRAAGGLGIVKLLLLLAPFFLVSRCSGDQAEMSGWSASWTAVNLAALGVPLVLPFLLVPITAVAAAAMLLFNSQRPFEILRRRSVWLLRLSIGSLAGLGLTPLLVWGAVHQLLIGWWATVAVDVWAIMALADVLTKNPARREVTESSGTLPATAAADDGSGQSLKSEREQLT
jgi:hypothetical protein